MNQMMIGAIALSCMIAALFFLRFWRNTGDRFFLFFALSFAVEGINRVLLGVIIDLQESMPLLYFIRLFAFVLILIAIADKNKRHSKQTSNAERALEK